MRFNYYITLICKGDEAHNSVCFRNVLKLVIFVYNECVLILTLIIVLFENVKDFC